MSRLPLPLFLALKYLKPGRSYVSVITIISVLGVLLGVMVLILVISVMSGFDRDLREKVLGMHSHITITGFGPIDHWKETEDKIEKTHHVTGVAPFVLGPVLVKSHNKVFTPYIKGVDPEKERKVSRLAQSIIEGKFHLNDGEVIIGSEMARRYGLMVGDKMLIYSPRNLENRDIAYLPEEPVVSGIFESGMFEYDVNFIFCSLNLAQELYDLGDRVHGLSVMTDQFQHISAVQEELISILPHNLQARTWMEMNRRLFSAIALEKNMMFFILIFIIIVAAFGIMSTLITVTVQKAREIGILKTLGATPFNIMSIFLFQGMIVGAIGTTLGLISGLFLLKYRNEFLEYLRVHSGFEIFPREVYNFDQLPAFTSPSDLAVICLSAFFICTLVCIVPAWRAARLPSAEAIRSM